MRILLSTTQRQFRISAEEDRAVRNIAESKSTAELPAFDLTFDKGWFSFHHERLQTICELLGGDMAMVGSTTMRIRRAPCRHDGD
jgi:hypothetical protein